MNMEIEQTANCPATTADRFLNPLMTAGFIMLALGSRLGNYVELHHDYFLAPAVAAFKVGKLDKLRPQFNVSRGKEIFVEDNRISLTHHWRAILRHGNFHCAKHFVSSHCHLKLTRSQNLTRNEPRSLNV